jgi:aminoglycoside 3-N-acetyltransferase
MPRPDWRAQPEVTRERLAADLRRLGPVDGQTVLVHSSLSRLGRVVGGAEAAVEALLDAVGPSGTLLFPTLTGARQDGPDCPPSIDLRATPCWTGRIPETARQRPAALRSLHPTHSVAAIGPAAERYASGHELAETPCDRHSPYGRLIDERGFILLLGATQSSNTTLHCLEELAEVPYHLQDDWTVGTVVDARGRAHAVRNRLHLWRWRRDFEKVDRPLADAGALALAHVGLAETRLVPARALHDTLLPRLLADPLYLLADTARRDYAETTPR